MNPTELFSSLPTIETQRGILRKMTLDDAPAMFEVAKDPEVPKYSPVWDAHRSIEDSLAFIRIVLDGYAKGTPAAWAIHHKRDNKFIGVFLFDGWDVMSKRISFGYWIGRPYWNQGIMTEVLKRMLRFGFEELNLNRINTVCDDLNIGSWRVMEKCGMKQEGLFRQHTFEKGRLRDTRQYAILREEWKKFK